MINDPKNTFKYTVFLTDFGVYLCIGFMLSLCLSNLKKSRKIDLSRGYTSTGVHRDDFIIYINKKIVSIYGSQGQQRTGI